MPSHLASAPEGEVSFALQEDGNTEASLWVEGRSVSRQILKPYALRIGAASLRAVGIGKVQTDESVRRRGFYRRLMQETLAHLESSDTTLALLHGIPGLYPRFGFATAGPEHCLHLTRLSLHAPLAEGWSIRPLTAHDLPTIREVYAECTALSVGTVTPATRDWDRLLRSIAVGSEDACRVAVSPSGEIRGYAWLSIGPWAWAVRHLQRRYPDAMVVGEALALDSPAADAVLSACRSWGVERSGGREQPYREVIIGTEPGGALVDAAMHHDASFARHYARCGESMARVVDVTRLLVSLEPELTRRLHSLTHELPAGTLRVTTDIGGADLVLDRGEVRTTQPSADTPAWHVRLPQCELARLCLGAFPPEHVLARLTEPPEFEASKVVAALFPLRQPHMHMPDRF